MYTLEQLIQETPIQEPTTALSQVVTRLVTRSKLGSPGQKPSICFVVNQKELLEEMRDLFPGPVIRNYSYRCFIDKVSSDVIVTMHSCPEDCVYSIYVLEREVFYKFDVYETGTVLGLSTPLVIHYYKDTALLDIPSKIYIGGGDRLSIYRFVLNEAAQGQDLHADKTYMSNGIRQDDVGIVKPRSAFNTLKQLQDSHNYDIVNGMYIVKLRKSIPVRPPNKKNLRTLESILHTGKLNRRDALCLLSTTAVITMPASIYAFAVIDIFTEDGYETGVICYNRYSYEVLHHLKITFYPEENFEIKTLDSKDLSHSEFDYLTHVYR